MRSRWSLLAWAALGALLELPLVQAGGGVPASNSAGPPSPMQVLLVGGGLLARLLAVPGAPERLLATLEARTDDDGLLFVRLDKQAAYQGRLELTQGEDCVQLRLKMEAYQAGRDASLAALRRMIASARP